MYLTRGTLFNAYPFKLKGGLKIMNEERTTFLALHNIEYHNKNGGDN